jgi:hypothetical protein
LVVVFQLLPLNCTSAVSVHGAMLVQHVP